MSEMDALKRFPAKTRQTYKRTCQDNFSPRNSPLISPLLPQTGTDFAQTSRTPKNVILYVRVVSDEP